MFFLAVFVVVVVLCYLLHFCYYLGFCLLVWSLFLFLLLLFVLLLLLCCCCFGGVGEVVEAILGTRFLSEKEALCENLILNCLV